MDKPMFNHFSVLHSPNEMIEWPGGFATEYADNFIVRLGSYRPVVNDFTCTELVNSVHFNPAPIFIPSPSAIFCLATYCLIFGLRRRSRGV